jgi:hypothetical protein
LEAAIQKAQTLLERSKVTNEHIVKQWKYAVKEKKKLQRDITSIVMSRDEAIQRNLSTLSQLDRVKDERDKLSRRVRSVDQNGNYSDASDTQCNLADCQFCTETSTSPHGVGGRLNVWYGGLFGMMFHMVCMVWCGVVWYGMVWYGMVWYGMVWYGMV